MRMECFWVSQSGSIYSCVAHEPQHNCYLKKYCTQTYSENDLGKRCCEFKHESKGPGNMLISLQWRICFRPGFHGKLFVRWL